MPARVQHSPGLQALEEAIERGLERVEAGAQGEHKIQRGYLPQLTYSSHYICDPHLRDLIAGSLHRHAPHLRLGLAPDWDGKLPQPITLPS